MLAAVDTGTPCHRTVMLTIARRSTSATRAAPSRGVAGRTSRNSSPPNRHPRSPIRAAARRRAPTAASTASPQRCPCRSFTDLKWSRSTIASDTGRRVRRPRSSAASSARRPHARELQPVKPSRAPCAPPSASRRTWPTASPSTAATAASRGRSAAGTARLAPSTPTLLPPATSGKQIWSSHSIPPVVSRTSGSRRSTRSATASSTATRSARRLRPAPGDRLPGSVVPNQQPTALRRARPGRAASGAGRAARRPPSWRPPDDTRGGAAPAPRAARRNPPARARLPPPPVDSTAPSSALHRGSSLACHAESSLHSIPRDRSARRRSRPAAPRTPRSGAAAPSARRVRDV